MEWKEMNICQMCDTISNTYKGNAEEVVLINTSDVLEGKCLNHEFVPNKNLKGQFKKTFKRNDILYSEIRPANKRFCFVDFDAENYIASTKLMVLRSHNDVNPMFLYQILRSDNTLLQLQTLAESRSGTFPQITYSELENVIVRVPSITAQDKIVSILSSLDRKIELNNKINAQLEEMAQAIFKSWFVDFEPFKDGKFVESELGMIPEGWRVGTLGDIAYLKAGGDKPTIISSTPNPTNLIPVYSNGIDNEGLYGYTNKANIFDESVTVSARGTIGFVCLRQTPYVPIVRLIAVIPNEKSAPKYLYLLLKRHHIEGNGSTQQQLTIPNFKKEVIIIPSKNIIIQFEQIVSNIFENIYNNKQENLHLSQLRDTLLPRLMSGEIDLDEIEKTI